MTDHIPDVGKKVLTPAEVGEIRERASKATPAPWHYCGQTRDGVCPCGHIGTGSDDHDYILAKVRWIGNADTEDPEDCELSTTSEEIFRGNLSFIAHSRVDVPALCDTIAALTRDLDEARVVMQYCEWRGGGWDETSEVGRKQIAPGCPACGGVIASGHAANCRLAAWLEKVKGGEV